jgi:hypothetical protein
MVVHLFPPRRQFDLAEDRVDHAVEERQPPPPFWMSASANPGLQLAGTAGCC